MLSRKCWKGAGEEAEPRADVSLLHISWEMRLCLLKPGALSKQPQERALRMGKGITKQESCLKGCSVDPASGWVGLNSSLKICLKITLWTQPLERTSGGGHVASVPIVFPVQL